MDIKNRLRETVKSEVFKKELEAEILGCSINRKMLKIFLSNQKFDEPYDILDKLLDLSIGKKHEEKLIILEDVGCSREEVQNLKKDLDFYDKKVDLLEVDLGRGGKTATIGVGTKRPLGNIPKGIKLEGFMKRLVQLIDFVIRHGEDDSSVKLCRDKYLELVSDMDLYPSHLTKKGIANILYAANPYAFPLTNTFVEGFLKDVTGGKVFWKKRYIELAEKLDAVLRELPIEEMHFGVIDRLASLIKAQDKDIEEKKSSEAASPSNQKTCEAPLNQILYGPPGTGKTYHTINKSVEIVDPDFYAENKDKRDKLKARFQQLKEDGRIGFVTFHQSFSYEDFVEGIKASSNDDGAIEYSVHSGVFKEMCDEAEKLPNSEPLVLIIDEINRGNISSIFGELITLIEPSKRAGADEALSVTLPYSKTSLTVPKNLYLIGTMNTADRSLAVLDTALRRRFDFIEMMPNASILAGVTVKGIDIKAMLKKMNQRIEMLYDREHTLGHTFFMPLLDISNEDEQFLELKAIFSNKILPLLEEYFFEDWGKIRLVLGLRDNSLPQNKQIICSKNNYKWEDLFGDAEDSNFADDEHNVYARNDEALNDYESYIAIYEDK